jgi:hypothetical protein
MANTFALTLKAQNNHPASSVIDALTHQIPDLIEREDSVKSAVAAFTSGASNTIAINASNQWTVAGSVQADPITGTALTVTNHRGLFVVAKRAVEATAPTVAVDAIASTTSLAIGTGSKAFTVAAALGVVANSRFRAVSATGGGVNWMEGICTYNTTTLTMTVDTISGASTFADWTIYALPVAQVTSTGFGLTVATPINLYEGSCLALYYDSASTISSVARAKVKAVNAQTLTISLAGVTGLQVSVLALGE